MAETRNVKVTTKDIDTVSEKLNEFAKHLPPGEQNVMAWLLGRAAAAPPDQLHGSLATAGQEKGGKETVSAAPAPAAQLSVPRANLTRALGVSQFAKMRPGTAAAGSSIGITATIMF